MSLRRTQLLAWGIVAFLAGAALTAASGRASAAGAVAAARVSQGLASFITHHQGVFAGKVVRYTAKAAETTVTGTDGMPWARIFSVSYIEDKGSPDRPVMFIFNGGPGASSAFLHIGALGPKRVFFPTDLQAPIGTSSEVTDNVYSPLDLIDLVFIDPPDTGYSRTLPGDKNHQYASVTGDAQLVARFIRDWLRDNHREDAPKFLLGESYGATRASLVASDLADSPTGAPVKFTGLILLSQLLTVDDLGQRPMNAQGFAINLPTMAAISWYHGKIDKQGRTFDDFEDEVRRFAFDQYLPALMLGNEIDPAEERNIAVKLSAFTGIASNFFVEHNLKFTITDYRRMLLPGSLLGGYDGRYVAVSPTGIRERSSAISDDLASDPAWTHSAQIVTTALATYLRDNLQVRIGGEYKINNSALGEKWDFGSKFRQPASTWLVDAIKKSPNLHLFAASGYDDLLAPFSGTRYLMSQLPLDRAHGQFHVYTGGHMFYTDSDSARSFSADLHDFIRSSLN